MARFRKKMNYTIHLAKSKALISCAVSLDTLICIFFFFFFNSVLRPFQDYFSSYEMDQSVGGAKTGEPREKPPDTPASRTWLVSHVARAELETTPDTAVR